jgi:Uri superfamily endonuclease
LLTGKGKTKWHVDHLEDGKFANVNEELEMHNKCKGVSKCNKFAEITFGYKL